MMLGLLVPLQNDNNSPLDMNYWHQHLQGQVCCQMCCRFLPTSSRFRTWQVYTNAHCGRLHSCWITPVARRATLHTRTCNSQTRTALCHPQAAWCTMESLKESGWATAPRYGTTTAETKNARALDDCWPTEAGEEGHCDCLR